MDFLRPSPRTRPAPSQSALRRPSSRTPPLPAPIGPKARFSKLRAEDEDRGRLALIFWSVARARWSVLLCTDGVASTFRIWPNGKLTSGGSCISRSRVVRLSANAFTRRSQRISCRNERRNVPETVCYYIGFGGSSHAMRPRSSRVTEFTPTEAGEYAYFCRILVYGDMKGTFVVR